MYKAVLNGYTSNKSIKRRLFKMAKESRMNVSGVKTEVCLMSDNLNYLCMKTKEILDAGNFGTINVVYDSVLNKKANAVKVSFEDVDSTLIQMRDLLGTSEYKNISITAKQEPSNAEGAENTKEESNEKEKKKKENSNTKADYRKGAPSLTQDILDYRYDVLSEYTSGKIEAAEAIKRLGVTDGVFRNMVSDYNKCKRMNRKKAFGKAGIIKRTYQQYESHKISSEQAAQNLGISIVTFLKWYKADTGKEAVGNKKGKR